MSSQILEEELHILILSTGWGVGWRGTDPEPSYRYPSKECPIVYVITRFSITAKKVDSHKNICIFFQIINLNT